ncbi:MAG: hypothetical protein RL095_2171 [Verrucomicrobiota bacterium]|jgi:hypothetical protein
MSNSHPNPAWRYRQGVIDAKAKAAAEAKSVAVGGQANREFDLLLSSLENDLKRLGGRPKGSARNKVKADELIPQYRAHLDKYIAAGDCYANPVLVEVMIWLFDIGELEQALRLATLAASQKQQLPERFTRRDIATFAADATLEWAKQQLTLKQPIEPHFGAVLALIDGGAWQVHDEILAKFLRLKADTLKDSEPAAALELLRRVLTLDPGASIKTALERLEKIVARQTPPPPAAGA